MGEWITNEEDIKNSILSDYQLLFETELPYSLWASKVESFSCTFLSEEERANLAAHMSEDKIRQGLWALKPLGLTGSMRGSSNISRLM